MEGDNFENVFQQGQVQAPVTAPVLPKLSFIPDELAKKYEGPLGLHEKCAYAGLVVGGISLISWVIIILGCLASVLGIALSVYGIKSRRSKHARIGLTLSVIGLIASIGYVVAAYNGMINYNYFTTEFFGS